MYHKIANLLKIQRWFVNQKSEGTILLHIGKVQIEIQRLTISVCTNSLDLFSILPGTQSMAWRVVDMFLLLPQFARNQKNGRRLPPYDIPLHRCKNSLFLIKANLYTLMNIALYWVTSSLPHARRLNLSMHRSNMEYANTWRKTRIHTWR